uniref:Folate gamma-glutamyl hydrolase n=1 Tax=Euplotes harpa TaxID=151035 RepID=A0A7S3J8Q6_9SPIT|mmetsp:Transcript_21566/g.24797  ORF Transcript_21566/g.24797 Transcript_21566/m.24797 type:complete len:201 (+) Transcript_21566:406-1008(+)
MGHQYLMFLVSKNPYFLKHTVSQHTQDPVIFNFSDKNSTKLFSEFPDDLLNKAENLPITANFHNWSLLTKDFLADGSPYKKFYKLLSTSLDAEGVSYVSNTEALNYPFFTAQFHPEVTEFTFSYNFTDHSEPAVEFANQLSLKFVGEAKKNSQRFASYDELVGRLVQKAGVDQLGVDSDGSFYDNYFFHVGNRTHSVYVS